MHEIESAAGDSTHEIIRAVNGAFVTPFDRADMHALAVALDNCVGLIEAAVDLIVLYRVDEVLPRVAKQVEIISRMAEITADAMPRLRAMKDLTATGSRSTGSRTGPTRPTGGCSPSCSTHRAPTPSR